MKDFNHIPILGKAVEIMEYIAAHPQAVSRPELQKALDIPQATCYRIVHTLLQKNWLVEKNSKNYDIGPGLAAVAGKVAFRMEKYQRLQPLLNIFAETVGYSAKISVRDGDEFVNVCAAVPVSTAKNASPVSLFSRPGFRCSLAEIASVSTIFLAAESEENRARIVPAAAQEILRARIAVYQTQNYTYNPGSFMPEAQYHFDTLSLPIWNDAPEKQLVGVLSCFALPGKLAAAPVTELSRALESIRPAVLDVLN